MVRVDAPEFGGQLVAVENVIRNDAVGRPDFLEHDRNLLPVRGRRIMKVDHQSTSWITCRTPKSVRSPTPTATTPFSKPYFAPAVSNHGPSRRNTREAREDGR